MKFDTLSLLFCLYVIVLVLMSIKYLFTKTKLTNTDIVIHLLVIVVLGLLVAFTNKREHFLNPANMDYKVDPLEPVTCGNNNNNNKIKESSMDELHRSPRLLVGKVNANPVAKVSCLKDNVKGDYGNNGAPLNYNMGPYAGVVIDAAKHQDRRMLIPGMDNKLRIGHKKADCGNLGSPCDIGLFKNPKYTDPLGEEEPLNLKYKSGPSVDGTPDAPKAMFMFAHNKCHPGCCPSTYSCDGGCVCTTQKQRDFIGNSGISRN